MVVPLVQGDGLQSTPLIAMSETFSYTSRMFAKKNGETWTWRGQSPVRSRSLARCALATGCRQDMHDQPKYEPLEASSFFPDGRASRPLVPGTVPWGQLREDTHLYEGKVAGKPAETFPFPDRPEDHGARPGALQHLLQSLPRPRWQRRRHGGAARLPPSSVVSHRTSAPSPSGLFL